MKQIIVIEDSPTTRLYYRTVLEEAGFAVDEAVNGLDGLEQAMSRSYDLAIVDVNMPMMDGYKMVEIMRRDPNLCALPVVMVSTEPPRDPAVHRLAKPARPADLVAMARRLTGTGQ
jgi:two-component system chemotaxis response regulator CheY